MRRDAQLWAALEDPRAAGPPEAPQADRRLPTLRLYAWAPWTVSLGNAQDPAAVLDLAALAERGYGWVKRPTGGRAVLHAEEITYAVAAPLSGPFRASLAASHRRIAQALARFYRAWGLEPSLTRPAGSGELDPRRPEPCFLAPGLAELEIDGRKLAGSAQRRGRRAFLQHGSLPLGDARLELADLLPLDGGQRRRVKESLAKRSACLADFLRPLPPRAELQGSLVAAFEAEFGLSWA
jgi:lipoate-protein ligase A